MSVSSQMKQEEKGVSNLRGKIELINLRMKV